MKNIVLLLILLSVVLTACSPTPQAGPPQTYVIDSFSFHFDHDPSRHGGVGITIYAFLKNGNMVGPWRSPNLDEPFLIVLSSIIGRIIVRGWKAGQQ